MHFFCDNFAAVCAITKRAVKCDVMASMLRALQTLEAAWAFDVSASHLPGEQNGVADALSRGYVDIFRNKLRLCCNVVARVQPDEFVLPPLDN